MHEQRRLIPFLLFLFIFGANILSIKGQEYRFETLSVEDGLSQITVSDICQDEKSRIWIATLDGLNCYDGNRIKVFNYFHNDSISYGNLYVTQMIDDGQGSLFLLTSTGLFQFDLATESYHLLPVSSPSIVARGKQGVWIVKDNKLFLYEKATHRLTRMYDGAQLSECGTSMIEDAAGTLWIALKEGGVVRVDTCGQTSSVLPGIKVMKLMSSRDRNIWIGSQGHGVFCFSPDGKPLRHYEYEENKTYKVRDDMARALCQDLEGNIWVGYRSGLTKIEVTTGRVFHYQADPTRLGALSNRSITSLYADKQGTVWVGTYWGGVILSLSVPEGCQTAGGGRIGVMKVVSMTEAKELLSSNFTARVTTLEIKLSKKR